MEPVPGIVKLVLWVEAALGLLIVLVSLNFYCRAHTKDELEVAKTVYDLVALQTLLPLFKTTITAVLTWIFGKPVITALAVRLAARRHAES